ncbi:ER membrane protein DP1/Yop1, partial [Ascosphaera pollenicola]
MQLWPLGRVADPVATKKAGYPLIAPTALYESEESRKAAEAAGNPVHELTTLEVEDLVDDFVNAAKNAVAAGVDYVEVHGAHGYLVDTFFQVSANSRTDKYGGSIENRSRFALEIIDRLIEEIGADRVAIRISPWVKFQGILAEEGEVNPVAQFGHFLSELENRARAGKRIAYVSIVEPRFGNGGDVPHQRTCMVTTLLPNLFGRALLSRQETTRTMLLNSTLSWRTYDICITGHALSHLSEHVQILDLLKRTWVYARVSPSQKEFLLTSLKEAGYNTLMCGDGTNDVGALKQAHIGVALLNGTEE